MTLHLLHSDQLIVHPLLAHLLFVRAHPCVDPFHQQHPPLRLDRHTILHEALVPGITPQAISAKKSAIVDSGLRK